MTDGALIPALHDMRPPAMLAEHEEALRGCNYCGCGAWNRNVDAAVCDHEGEVRTRPRATAKWVCIYCDHQSDDWPTTFKHYYNTGHGFVSTEQPEER